MSEATQTEIETMRSTIPDEWGEPFASQQMNDEFWVAYSPGDESESEIIVVKYERWDGEWEHTGVKKTTLSRLHQMLYNRFN